MITKTIKEGITNEQRQYSFYLVKQFQGEYLSAVTTSQEVLYSKALALICTADILNVDRPKRIAKYAFNDIKVGGVNIYISNRISDGYFDPKYSPTIKTSEVLNKSNNSSIVLFTSINKKTLKFEIIGWIRRFRISEREEGITSHLFKRSYKNGDGSSSEVKVSFFKVEEPALQQFLNKEYFINNIH